MKLAECKIAYCDSIDALKQAYDEGLSKDAVIYSASPALLMSDLPNTFPIDEFDNFNEFENSFYESKDFLKQYYEIFKDHPILGGFSIMIAREAYMMLRQIFTASLYTRHGEQLFAFIEIETGTDFNNTRMNPLVSDLIRNEKNCIYKQYKVNPTSERMSDFKPIDFLTRFKLIGPTGLFYRLLLRIHQFLPQSIFNKCCYIMSDAELGRDVGYYLGRKGYYLKSWKLPKFSKHNDDFVNEINGIKEESKKHFLKYSNLTCPQSWSEKLFDKFHKKTIENYLIYKNGLVQYPKIITQLKNKNKKILFLLNYPKGAHLLAFSQVCNKRNIPVISCQHGVTREILSKRSSNNIIRNENGITTDVFNYSVKASQINNSLDHKLKKNSAHPIGLPIDYTRLFQTKEKEFDLLYVSTTVYHGHIINHTYPYSDLSFARWEIDLVKKVFEPSQLKVGFKPYPSLRYPDEDPVIKEIQGSDNIQVLGTHVDFRYLTGKSKIIMTSRATSTFAWCLMANTPLIYIDLIGRPYLEDHLKNLYQGSIFYFDEADPEYMDKILALLRKPYEDILNEWQSMKVNREQFIKEYLNAGLNKHTAGKKSYEIIEKLIQEQ